MKVRARRVAAAAVISLLLAVQTASAGDEKPIVGSYKLALRTMKDGTKVTPPDALGFMTFSKTHRTVILKWKDAKGEPVSIAFISAYTLADKKFCETVIYGVNSNLGEPGVTYDEPTTTPACTVVTDDATGLAFDVPSERLRFRISRDGVTATTPRHTDTWERVK